MLDDSASEQWRWVVGYEGSYAIHRDGSVVSHLRGGRVMKTFLSRKGYPNVTLADPRVPRGQKNHRVHILMLEAFVGLRPSPESVGRHLNDVKTDLRLENLAWGNKSQNALDAVRNGTHFRGGNGGVLAYSKNPRPRACKRGHEYTTDNLFPRADGRRECRTCRGIRLARRNQARASSRSTPEEQ